MDTSLKAARDYIYNDRSWASTGKTLDKRVNTCLTRALRDIAGEVPEALVPEEHHVHVRKNVVGGDTTINAKIKKTTDLKVLEFVRSGTWKPTVDGTWDGVMYLEITDPDNRIRRRRAREWWESDSGTFYVSIDRPWFDTGTTEMDFRIYQPSFYLPANTIEVLTPMRLFDDSEQLVGQISSGTARREYLPDFRQRVSGRPTDFWRGEFQQLPSPTEAPKVSSALKQDQTVFFPWKGPVQEGKFEFCYTYAWGRKEQEWGESAGNFNDPQFESAPSPVSDVFDHKVEVDELFGNKIGRAIVIECRSLEEMLDFVGNAQGVPVDDVNYDFPTTLPSGAPLRYGRSGIKIRIYVRRLATYEDHGYASTPLSDQVVTARRLNRVEADEKFYLLAELDPLEKNAILKTASPQPITKVSTFVWEGAPTGTDNNIAPDPTRQLRKNTGYYAYNVWPIPDQDYDIDVSLLRQPKELVNDNDQLPIKQEAFSAYMELALAYMSRLDGVDQNSEVKHRALYRQLVRRFRSQHGDNNGIVENKAWGDIRPRYRYGTFQEG